MDFSLLRFMSPIKSSFDPGGNVHVIVSSRSPMQAPRPWLNQFVIAALGAGVVTSFAVAQGQNPFLALGITVFSGMAAVMLGQIL